MAYTGTGTLAGGVPRPSSQVLFQIEWVVGDDDTVSFPVVRLPGTVNVHVEMVNLDDTNPLDVDLVLFGPAMRGFQTLDLVGSDQYRPIREPVNVVVPPGEARAILYEWVGEPNVFAQITDARETPNGAFPVLLRVTATS